VKRSNHGFLYEIATHLSGARNDRLGKGFLFLNRDLDGCTSRESQKAVSGKQDKLGAPGWKREGRGKERDIRAERARKKGHREKSWSDHLIAWSIAQSA
jgi:hypothetical protein